MQRFPENTVADVVEAVASHRPYRPALGIEKAIKEIETNRGTKFDACVVDACVSVLRNKKFSFDLDDSDSNLFFH